jgi:hypothetical protein
MGIGVGLELWCAGGVRGGWMAKALALCRVGRAIDDSLDPLSGAA